MYIRTYMNYICILNLFFVGKDCPNYCQGAGYCMLTGMKYVHITVYSPQEDNSEAWTACDNQDTLIILIC